MQQPSTNLNTAFSYVRYISLALIAVFISFIYLMSTKTNVVNFKDYHSNWQPKKVEWVNSLAQRQKLSDLKGNVLIVSFWAEWCAPCKKELPLFYQLHKNLKDLPVKIVLVNVDDESNLARAKAFLPAESELISVYNVESKSKTNIDLNSQFNVGVLPAHFIFNKNNMLIYEIYRPLDWTNKSIFKQLKGLAQDPL